MRLRTTALIVALAILTSSCTAWNWGGAVEYRDSGFTPSEDSDGWIATAVGGGHVCRIDMTQNLWCQGRNAFGQSGGGTGDDPQPLLQVGTQQWSAVATAHVATCGVQIDGTLWCWGYAGEGDVRPVDPSVDHAVPTQMGNDADWVTVDGEFAHWCATKTDDSLWCWGANTYAQLGDGSSTFSAEPIRIGQAGWHSVAVTLASTCGVQLDGSLWCWGTDLTGSTGHGADDPDGPVYSTPRQVGSDHTWTTVNAGEGMACALRTDRTLWCWGSYGFDLVLFSDVPAQVGASSTWRSVDAGIYSVCGIQTDNSLWCWGMNVDGSVGDGTVIDRWEPVQIAPEQTWISVSVFYGPEALALS